MKPSALALVLTGAALALAGGVTYATATPRPSPPGSPPARGLDLPGAPGAGDPREVRVLVDEPSLKLVSIVLRRGTVLPEHQSAVPVTIQALRGAGTVVAGSTRLRVDPIHAVFLAAKAPHAVEPDAGTDLVLLVHHLGRGEERHH